MMKHTIQTAFFIFCGAAALTAGCDLYSSVRPLRVEIPPLPGVWSSLEDGGWEGKLLCGAPGLQAVPCRPGDTLTVPWPKDLAGLLLFYPEPGRSLKPAGAVWGRENPAGTVKLTWEEGWLAEVLWPIALESHGLPPKNWTRIRELFLKEEGAASPWLLDRKVFRKSVETDSWGTGTFRTGAAEVVIEVPPGRWIPGDPFLPVLEGPSQRRVPLGRGISLWRTADRFWLVQPRPEGGQEAGVFSTLTWPSAPAM